MLEPYTLNLSKQDNRLTLRFVTVSIVFGQFTTSFVSFGAGRSSPGDFRKDVNKLTYVQLLQFESISCNPANRKQPLFCLPLRRQVRIELRFYSMWRCWIYSVSHFANGFPRHSLLYPHYGSQARLDPCLLERLFVRIILLEYQSPYLFVCIRIHKTWTSTRCFEWNHYITSHLGVNDAAWRYWENYRTPQFRSQSLQNRGLPNFSRSFLVSSILTPTGDPKQEGSIFPR